MVFSSISTRQENALINARRAKECKNYKEAKQYYDMVKMEDPENWEAAFYSTYCGVINADISQAVKFISNCIKMVLKDIKKLKNNDEQNKAIKQISTDLLNYALISQVETINGYHRCNSDVWSKTSIVGVVIGEENHNVNVLSKIEAF